MFLTEKDAAKKWCPMKRLPYDFTAGSQTFAVAVNAHSYGLDSSAKCEASDCMMWRWKEARELATRCADDPFATEEPVRPHDVPDSWKFEPYKKGGVGPAAWVGPQSAATRCGYCGLAGKP